MKINIRANKIDLTPSITKYIEDKIGSLDKFVEGFEVDGETKVSVEIARTSKHHLHGEVFCAEASLNLKKHILMAKEIDEDAYVVIDKVKDTLKIEILKFKEKEEKLIRLNKKDKASK